MRLFEDVICIILLLFMPGWFLERSGMYDAMDKVREGREARYQKLKSALKDIELDEKEVDQIRCNALQEESRCFRIKI